MLRTSTCPTLRPNTMSDQTDPSRQLAAAMTAELASLLDSVPKSRQVLQHLAVVEKVLRLHGLNGLMDVPEAALRKAHAQLSNLPVQDHHTALSRLQSLLGLQVEAPDRATAHLHQNTFISSFLTEEKLQVSEGSHSDFIRLQDEPTSGRR